MESSPTKITFYTKPDCPLCVDGYAKVERLAGEFGLQVEKVNIETDPELFELHKHRIPVAELDGKELGWGRISERALRRALTHVVE